MCTFYKCPRYVFLTLKISDQFLQTCVFRTERCRCLDDSRVNDGKVAKVNLQFPIRFSIEDERRGLEWWSGYKRFLLYTYFYIHVNIYIYVYSIHLAHTSKNDRSICRWMQRWMDGWMDGRTTDRLFDRWLISLQHDDLLGHERFQ